MPTMQIRERGRKRESQRQQETRKKRKQQIMKQKYMIATVVEWQVLDNQDE